MSAITKELLVKRRVEIQTARDHFEKQVIAQDGALAVIDALIAQVEKPESVEEPVGKPAPVLQHKIVAAPPR